MQEDNGLSGIITPTITPIKNSTIDYGAVQKLVTFLIKSKVNGIFPTGSIGSAPLLNIEMHKEVISAFSDANNKLKFFPGVGRNSIDETLKVANHAIRKDADAIIIVTPYYMRLDQNSIFRYFDKLISKMNTKVILYNIPQLTGNWIYPDSVIKLTKKYKNIIGLKESSGDFRKFAYYVSLIGNRLPILQGQDDLLLPSLSIGAIGGVCGTTNFVDTAIKIYNKFTKGDMKTSMDYQTKLTDIVNLISESKFPQIFNYLFYNRIMSKDETNALGIYSAIDNKKAKKISNEINEILQK